jgi:hypothetical protein
MNNTRPAVWRNEPTGPALYSTIGNIVPVPVDAMEMLPALRAGTVNVIAAPALAAEQLQWIPYLDHVNDNVIVCAVGGLIFKAGVLEALRIRKLDEEAYGRISQKMTLVKMTQAERDEWEKLLRRVVKQLSRGTYDRALVNKVLTLRGMEPID